jgi:hypothetical protein
MALKQYLLWLFLEVLPSFLPLYAILSTVVVHLKDSASHANYSLVECGILFVSAARVLRDEQWEQWLASIFGRVIVFAPAVENLERTEYSLDY